MARSSAVYVELSFGRRHVYWFFFSFFFLLFCFFQFCEQTAAIVTPSSDFEPSVQNLVQCRVLRKQLWVDLFVCFWVCLPLFVCFHEVKSKRTVGIGRVLGAVSG